MTSSVLHKALALHMHTYPHTYIIFKNVTQLCNSMGAGHPKMRLSAYLSYDRDREKLK